MASTFLSPISPRLRIYPDNLIMPSEKKLLRDKSSDAVAGYRGSDIISSLVKFIYPLDQSLLRSQSRVFRFTRAERSTTGLRKFRKRFIDVLRSIAVTSRAFVRSRPVLYRTFLVSSWYFLSLKFIRYGFSTFHLYLTSKFITCEIFSTLKHDITLLRLILHAIYF